MAKKDAAKRAAKKHLKEKKRQKKLDARPPKRVQEDPVDAWRPVVEGIEGLAHRLDVGSHDAAHLAELVATHGRRAEATKTWLPSRVRALTDDEILVGLATRGIVTDKPSFVALAEAREGARDLAIEVWKPSMHDDASPHDRDFVAEAAVTLWERWAPDHLSDETLHDLLRTGFDHSEDGRLPDALETLCTVWDRARGNGGLARIARADGRGEHFAAELVTLLDGPEGATDAQIERGLATLREVRAELPADAETYVPSLLAEARTLEALGRPEEGIRALLAVAPGLPMEPDLLGEATEIYGVWSDAPAELGEELRAVLTTVRDAAEGPVREVYDNDLGRLEELLAKRASAS